VSFLGYKKDRDPDDNGPLSTSKSYRFVAGFGTWLTLGYFSHYWRPWAGSAFDWWMIVTACVVGIGAVREGMGFINYILFWRIPGHLEEINYWYLALLICTIGVLIVLYFKSH
jgi:hypothetical protein